MNSPNCRRAGLFFTCVALTAFITVAASAQPIRVGSITRTRQDTAIALDGDYMVQARAKLLNPANFGGATAPVKRSIVITDTAATSGSVTAGLLANFDVFVPGYVRDGLPTSLTPSEVNAMQTWVSNGGVLVAHCGSYNQPFCEGFGLTSTNFGSESVVVTDGGRSHPIFNGPFGAVTTYKGYLPLGFNSTAGTTVLAQTSDGKSCFFVRGSGKGTVIIASDDSIDDLTVTFGPAITSPNDRVLGNAIAFAASIAAPSCPPGNPLGTSFVPVVGSAAGSLGSFFRTAVQLHNSTNAAITGCLVFHPAGRSGAAGDPAMSYAIAPGATTAYADLLPVMGQAGLGSLDVVAGTGAMPVVISRVFNDGGAAGTSGFTEDLFSSGDALNAGDRGVILVPDDLTNFRMNIGVRTLSAAVTMSVTFKDSTGAQVTTLTRNYAPSFFEQTTLANFLGGVTASASGSVTIQMMAGSAIVYGATTDNRTQDPSLQIARRAP